MYVSIYPYHNFELFLTGAVRWLYTCMYVPVHQWTPTSIELFIVSTDFNDFQPLVMNITFEASVTEQVVQIAISNDDVVENNEAFNVTIEAVDGVYPVDVIDSVVEVEIADNDRKSYSYNSGFIAECISARL